MPARPLSREQLEDAQRLKAQFKHWQEARRAAGLPFSQDAVAELFGFGQSALSQYLTGKIPLNVDALLKFCDVLGIQPFLVSTSLARAIEQRAAWYAERAEGSASKIKPLPAASSSLIPEVTVTDWKPGDPVRTPSKASLFIAQDVESALIVLTDSLARVPAWEREAIFGLIGTLKGDLSRGRQVAQTAASLLRDLEGRLDEDAPAQPEKKGLRS